MSAYEAARIEQWCTGFQNLSRIPPFRTYRGERRAFIGALSPLRITHRSSFAPLTITFTFTAPLRSRTLEINGNWPLPSLALRSV